MSVETEASFLQNIKRRIRKMNIGNKIKALRLKASATQEMLAEALGVSSQSVSKWENNVCAPDISLLPEISEFFGVTIDELFDLS